MTELPRIAIEESAVNDVIVLLDALLPSDALAEAVDDPAALYTRYRAELRLFRQLLVPQSSAPAPRAAACGEPDAAVDAVAQLAAGSILR
jgi:hypothetical protein